MLFPLYRFFPCLSYCADGVAARRSIERIFLAVKTMTLMAIMLGFINLAVAQDRIDRTPANLTPRYQLPGNQASTYRQTYQGQTYQPKRYQPNPQRFTLSTPKRRVETSASATGSRYVKRSSVNRDRPSQQTRAPKRTVPRSRYIQSTFEPVSLFPRIAGDFEKQKAILISVCELLPTHEDVLVQLVNACQGHVTVGILVDDRKQLIAATRVLMKQNREYDHVKFYNVDLDTIWLRDFGPRIGELKNGEAVSFDFLYEGTRPRDEKLPKAWSKLTGEKYHAVPWTMQGGNLLFNGRGLALTTDRIFKDNYVRFKNLLPGTDPEVERRQMVVNEFKRNCNLDQLIVLEPLRNEPTQHVDMFAAFVAPDHVVVTALDRKSDPVNAAVLDRNVKRLKNVNINGSPLKVTRIPTPAREGKYWSTFTNVIIANDLVILPSFDNNPRAFVERAVSVYKSVLPNHKVKVVDTTTLKRLEGSVHCMSINVPHFAKLPPTYLSLKKSIAWIKAGEASVESVDRTNKVSLPRHSVGLK